MTTRRGRRGELREARAKSPTVSALVYELDEVRDRAGRYRTALGLIAACTSYCEGDVVDIARETLTENCQPMSEEELFTAKEVFACLEIAAAIARCYGGPARNQVAIHARAMAYLRAFVHGTPVEHVLLPGTGDSDVNVVAIPLAARRAWEKAMKE